MIRAMQVRTSRYDSRTWRRNHWVTTTISGSTAKDTAASRQSIVISTTRMPASMTMSPNTATTPAENRSFSASTSLVTRVISRPTGCRS